jgi:mono/diheme cytochrome c family protein
MRQNILLLLIMLFVAIAFFVNQSRLKSTNQNVTSSNKEDSLHKDSKGSEQDLRSVKYLEFYIEDIINNGSSQKLGFAYGDMEGGFADKDAAKKIAAYVVTLSGKKPTHPEWVKDGHTFFISNCGGCHGEDGKGIHGTFPDLTRKTLLGIEHRLNGRSPSN